MKNEKSDQEEGNCSTRQYRVRFDYFLTYLSPQITVSYLIISFSLYHRFSSISVITSRTRRLAHSIAETFATQLRELSYFKSVSTPVRLHTNYGNSVKSVEITNTSTCMNNSEITSGNLASRFQTASTLMKKKENPLCSVDDKLIDDIDKNGAVKKVNHLQKVNCPHNITNISKIIDSNKNDAIAANVNRKSNIPKPPVFSITAKSFITPKITKKFSIPNISNTANKSNFTSDIGKGKNLSNDSVDIIDSNGEKSKEIGSGEKVSNKNKTVQSKINKRDLKSSAMISEINTNTNKNSSASVTINQEKKNCKIKNVKRKAEDIATNSNEKITNSSVENTKKGTAAITKVAKKKSADDSNESAVSKKKLDDDSHINGDDILDNLNVVDDNKNSKSNDNNEDNGKAKPSDSDILDEDNFQSNVNNTTKNAEYTAKNNINSANLINSTGVKDAKIQHKNNASRILKNASNVITENKKRNTDLTHEESFKMKNSQTMKNLKKGESLLETKPKSSSTIVCNDKNSKSRDSNENNEQKTEKNAIEKIPKKSKNKKSGKKSAEKVYVAEHSSGEDSLCLGSDNESVDEKHPTENGKNDRDTKRKFQDDEGEVLGTDVNSDSDDDDSLLFG